MSLFGEYCDLLASEGLEVGRLRRLSAVSPRDVLVVVDMQRDFLPGGSFAVPEGDDVVSTICTIMQQFSDAGASIFCTRDYHPVNHCSFCTQGGPFPQHCVQGTTGSFFAPAIATKIQQIVQKDVNSNKGVTAFSSESRIPCASLQVVFKGYSPDIDSFGALPYAHEDAEGRVSQRRHSSPEEGETFFCSLQWTGATCLFSSNFDNDPNAPPDVLSILRPVSLGKAALAASVSRGGGGERPKLYFCGLALDFCVLDSAINAARSKDLAEVFDVVLVLSAARAAHIAGVGKFGSGFLSDPRELVSKLQEYSVELIMA